MEKEKRAFFVYRPRRVQELFRPHILEEERAYQIRGIVILSRLSYENFGEDLLADRIFLERSLARRREGPLPCLLVRTKRGKDGILVHPQGAFVVWAAYYSGGSEG